MEEPPAFSISPASSSYSCRTEEIIERHAVSTAPASPRRTRRRARPSPSLPCGGSSPARSSITSAISHPNASAYSVHSVRGPVMSACGAPHT
ncbi:hypothetical protein ACOBQB_25935 [Streptomyces sp. G5(2025)]|uniref:hypothetical protein n=1 Tax=Streptomyces sp. G5(2025) TaxID=3406628 RepID=UPI003C133AC3